MYFFPSLGIVTCDVSESKTSDWVTFLENVSDLGKRTHLTFGRTTV